MNSRYLILTMFSLVLSLGAVAAFNFVVDPYDLSGHRLHHINQKKPAVGRHLVRAKLAQINRVRPRTVVTGNSRVDVGINPSSPVWPDSWRPVYNLGLPGVGPTGLENVLKDALDGGRTERVVLGLDFIDFLVAPSTIKKTAKTGAENMLEPLVKFLETTFSLDALMDSVSTVMVQRRSHSANLTPDGYNPLEEYVAMVANEGHSVLFDQRERQNLRNYARSDRRFGKPSENPQVLALERILGLLKEAKVETILFVHPYHARILEGLRQTGRWQELKEWRVHLASLADRYGFRLYDFAMYDQDTQEAVPVPGDKRALIYYWEAGHYKSAMGDKIITELTEEGQPSFGRVVTSESIESVQIEFERQGHGYVESRQDVVNRIRDFLE